MNNNNHFPQQHPSRFKLDSYIMASCSTDDLKMIESHCLSCKECKEYLNALSDSSTVLTTQFPDFKSLDEACSTKSTGKKLIPVKTVKFHPYLGPAIAALFVFALVIPVYFMMNPSRGDLMQVKGSPQWFMFTESKFVQSAAHEVNVHAFDTVQLFLQANKPLYFTIMYRDDGGLLKVYNAENELLHNSSDGKPVPLPFSIVLDSLWNGQDIYCVASENKLSAETIALVIKDDEQLNDTTTGIWIRKFTLHRK